ncbi:MAG: phosphoribosylglycinamide formyltransferase [Alphaproteobacteria bacterium]
MARLKTAVLISGRGTNMQALLDACAPPDAPAEIVLVISNVAGAGGLDRAANAGVPAEIIDHREYSGRAAFERALTERLEHAEVGLVCLAGFMRLLTSGFVEHWRDRLINIHPSLLPAYKGLDTHARALADGVRITGCTVHFVRPDMDAGPIIVQAAVPVHPGDDAESLAARVLTAEHECYPRALALVASGHARVIDERVEIDGKVTPENLLINPG